MGNSRVSTPIGKITIGPDTTPSRSASRTISEMKGEFVKIARSGSVPAEKLKDDRTSPCPTYF
jgi:hypothetical protein